MRIDNGSSYKLLFQLLASIWAIGYRFSYVLNVSTGAHGAFHLSWRSEFKWRHIRVDVFHLWVDSKAETKDMNLQKSFFKLKLQLAFLANTDWWQHTTFTQKQQVLHKVDKLCNTVFMTNVIP